MPDHKQPDNNNLPPSDENDDASPSAIFAEMMRQAAARRQQDPAPENDGNPLADNAPAETELPFEFYVADMGDTMLVPDPESTPSEDPESEIHFPPEYFASPPATETTPEMVPEARSVPEKTPEQLEQEAAIAAQQAKREEAMRQQRIQRVRRRKARRRQRRAGAVGGFVRTLIVVLLSAALASTIFTWFTSPDLYDTDVVTGLQVANATGVATSPPTPLPTPNWLKRIGIVSGHRGPENDPGAVCPDGLTEAEINFNVAQLAVRSLRSQGYTVDLLDEFDPRLNDYQAAALLSIHANTCQDYGEVVSGFLVAKAAARPEGGPDTQLAECVGLHYGAMTGLERRFTLTLDMTDYHSFREIHPLTPAAILELGFMFSDRQLLTEETDVMSEAITRGILCFLNPDTSAPATPVQPTAEATLDLVPGA